MSLQWVRDSSEWERRERARQKAAKLADDARREANAIHAIPAPDWVRTVIVEVAKSHGISVERMMSRSRARGAVIARIEAINRLYLSIPSMTTVKIGSIFGLHHTTILNALGRISKREAARVTEEQEAQARAMREQGMSYFCIANALGVSKNKIRFLLIAGEHERVKSVQKLRRAGCKMPPWVPDKYALDWRRAAHQHGEHYAAGVVRALKRAEVENV